MPKPAGLHPSVPGMDDWRRRAGRSPQRLRGWAAGASFCHQPPRGREGKFGRKGMLLRRVTAGNAGPTCWAGFPRHRGGDSLGTPSPLLQRGSGGAGPELGSHGIPLSSSGLGSAPTAACYQPFPHVRAGRELQHREIAAIGKGSVKTNAQKIIFFLLKIATIQNQKMS